MKIKKLIVVALLVVLFVGILGTAAASPLRVTAVSSYTGKVVPNTKICAHITANSNSAIVWSKCGNTNNGQYAFEVPGQYTGQSYTLYVIASATEKKKISASYLGRFKNPISLRMR